MLPRNSIVIVHLVQPTEKLWGILGELGQTGIVLRAINVESFDDWMSQVARGETRSIDLSTMFVPLFRVERVYLDEQVGEVESYRQRFERRVGRPAEHYLGLEPAEGEVPS